MLLKRTLSLVFGKASAHPCIPFSIFEIPSGFDTALTAPAPA